MKKALGGRRFPSDEGVVGAVQLWLKLQLKNFFSGGVKKHVERWNRRVYVDWNYVEK
jgi:hypothetical protein